MSRLFRFLRLSWSDQRLLIQALLLVCAVRLGLWLVPFDRIRRRVQRMARARPLNRTPRSAEKLIRAVEAMAGCVPSATCLTQALAAHLLLRRAGYPSILRVGVMRSQTVGFKAHAWVEHEGRIVVGEIENLGEFKALASMGADD